MTLTAGTLSQTSVASNSAQLAATAATGGTGPYTYQWYRSTSSGFTPGGGNLISGAMALTLSDTGLIPNTVYYYKVVATDTGHSNDTVIYTQLAVTTTGSSLGPNQFAQTPTLGMIDQRFPYDTLAVQVDVSQATPLFSGSAVKMVDSAGGTPKVIGCTADNDQVLGFINFDIKDASYGSGAPCEISADGNVLYLYATGPISRGARVVLDTSSPGSVAAATGSTAKRVVGWAYDKATSYGQLIRVFTQTPSFTLDS